MNPLRALQSHGQSIWLDYLHRSLITNGELKRLVEEDALQGITSNPTIFEKAISGSRDYEDLLTALTRRQDLDAKGLYEQLAMRDIRDAAELLRPVYDKAQKRDGYVCLEVTPDLAYDTRATIAEARRLWPAIACHNLMIKVPATAAGIPALRDLICEGINVNVTLLFSQETYEQVADAYITGLEQRAAQGHDLSHMASVASFFVSRIDSAIDSRAMALLKTATDTSEQATLREIIGRVAIANAKLAYQRYKEIFRGPRWETLANQGAQTQRLLWASTSTKNADYRDVVYVEELIGPETVNTMPPATLEAFRDHGQPRASLEERIEVAQGTMDKLVQAGISMREVTDHLLAEGIRLFAESFAKLLDTVETKRTMILSEQSERLTRRHEQKAR